MPTPPPEILVVDYDAGNLRSVQRALEAVGQRPLVTSDPRAIERAAALVLPGVGSAQDCMRKLAVRGLVRPLQDYAASGRPFLGVCVGLQLLFERSEEGGGVECLGILPGVVRRFASHDGLKVPQIGWNARSQQIALGCSAFRRADKSPCLPPLRQLVSALSLRTIRVQTYPLGRSRWRGTALPITSKTS